MANWCSCTLTVRGRKEAIARFRAEEGRHLDELQIALGNEEGHATEDRDGHAAMACMSSVTYRGVSRWAPNTAYLGPLSLAFGDLVFDLEMLELNALGEVRVVYARGMEVHNHQLDGRTLCPLDELGLDGDRKEGAGVSGP